MILESNSGLKNYLINELNDKIDKKLIFTLILLGYMA